MNSFYSTSLMVGISAFWISESFKVVFFLSWNSHLAKQPLQQSLNCMATDQYLTHSSLHKLPLEDGAEECNSGGFECNICLDTVQDPVVTICGHLYCWPCIYKWIHQQHSSCPVCKSQVSERTLIPLYGRGQSDEMDENLGPLIPHRPKGPPSYVAATSARTSQHEYGSLGGSAASHPMISMFGEMICARLFGGSLQRFDTYPNSYGVAATGSARARRNVRQVDQSLSRLSVFLYCCLVLCLVFF